MIIASSPNAGTSGIQLLAPRAAKDYDPVTGETSWATTACALIPAAIYRQLNGFDAESFFLYCDDVDFSWRVRHAGFKVVFQPAAVAFHDKRLSGTGKWMPSSSERRYSAEAALFLAHKWSRPDLVERYLEVFSNSEEEDMRRASVLFEERRRRGLLPAPVDPEHRTAQFLNGFYARHRFSL